MKFGYTIVYVRNVAETVAFYESAFGLTRRFVHQSGTYAEMETGETALAFADEVFVGTCHAFTPNSLNETAPGVEVGFLTDDVRKAFDHAIRAGAKPYVEPMTKPWGQIVSYVRDNNGFLVEICSPVAP